MLVDEMKILRSLEQDLYDSIDQIGERLRTVEFLVQNGRPVLSQARPSDQYGQPLSQVVLNERLTQKLEDEGVMNQQVAVALGTEDVNAPCTTN